MHDFTETDTGGLLTEATVKAGGAPLTGRMGRGRSIQTLRKHREAVPIDRLLAEVQRTADLPLAEAFTLPPDVYTSEEFLQWEVQHVLGCDWICLAHISQIPKPGDFINVDVLGEPLIVVHGKDGVVRVLSRVCPHRAMDIMPPGFGYDGHGPADVRDGSPGCGHTRLFLCPYHHWSFELDGRLKGCPEMHKAQGFRRDETGLREFRSSTWNGFVFFNLSGTASPLDAQYTELNDDISGWNPAEMQVAITMEWECPFNWKVLVENFMEGYHHLGAHCKSLQPFLPAKNTWTTRERAHSMRVNLPYKEGFVGAEDSGFPPILTVPEDQRRQMAVYLGMPAFLLFTGPDRMFWYRIDPVSAGHSRLLTTCLVSREAMEAPDFETRRAEAEKMLVEFHLEDMEVCVAVQRGFSAAGYQRGRLSHLEMPLWLLGRYLAARARGTYPTIDREPAPAQQ